MTEASRVYRHLREVFWTLRGRKRSGMAEAGTGEPESRPFGPNRDPRKLGEALGTLTQELNWNSPLAQQELLLGWEDLVGVDTASHCSPIGVDRGVLTVRCDSTAWATQLRLIRHELVTRITEKYPHADIETIKFHGPDAPSWKRGPRSVPGRGPRDTYG